MSDQEFFDSMREQSLVKAEIVSKYFWAWANVMKGVVSRTRSSRIAYIDLFSGPGYYQHDGCPSTPLRILEQVINGKKDAWIRENLVSIFNDKNKEHAKSLEEAIQALPDIGTLRYHPTIWNFEVGNEIIDALEAVKLVPTLLFADPFGYKGLSLRLIGSVLRNWGCDCIIFFNYNRINMALENPIVQGHMADLFGEERARELKSKLEQLVPEEREVAIVEEIAQALKELGGQYVLPFRFRNEQGTRTSHYLIFVSKHFKGYEIMKGIMAGESSSKEQGVASLEYSPATERQPLLSGLLRPLDDLGDSLCQEFSGQRLTMLEIYQQHNVGTPYIKGNYKNALLKLEAEGRITAYSAKRRDKNTFADHVIVTFP